MCQARFNNAYAQVVKLRGKLSDQDTAARSVLASAQQALFQAVFTNTGPGAAKADIAAYQVYAARYASYQATENAIAATRKAHPFPPLPSAACT